MSEDQTPTSTMNIEPLETFVTDAAMILAGSVTGSDEVEPFTPEQLGLIFFSGVAAYARTRPDYDAETDISGVIQLGVAVYAESIYATVNAAMQSLQEQSEAEAA